MFENLSHDVRYATRALRQSPAFVATAVLTLTFAIGINVGIFATLNAVALRLLPAPGPHELVRLALGAERRSIVKSIVREGLAIALAGIALGIGISMLSTRYLGAMLFDISPRDPLVLLGAPMLLAAIAICACLVPALRAASIDPTIGLRTE